MLGLELWLEFGLGQRFRLGVRAKITIFLLLLDVALAAASALDVVSYKSSAFFRNLCNLFMSVHSLSLLS